MNPTTIKEAIQAAEVFLKAAKQVEIKQYESGKKYVETGRNTATAKRKSMDLTHALADLRKSL
jgi:hypothetical protein